MLFLPNKSILFSFLKLLFESLHSGAIRGTEIKNPKLSALSEGGKGYFRKP